jgi:hypothetical protein
LVLTSSALTAAAEAKRLPCCASTCAVRARFSVSCLSADLRRGGGGVFLACEGWARGPCQAEPRSTDEFGRQRNELSFRGLESTSASWAGIFGWCRPVYAFGLASKGGGREAQPHSSPQPQGLLRRARLRAGAAGVRGVLG